MSFDSTLREVEVEKTSDNDRNKESGDLQIARKKVTSNVMRCSVCQMSFDSRNEQKAHYQTDYHLMNVKRNLRGLDILSVEEFDALISKEHGIKSEDENSDGEQTSSDHEESEEASDRDPDLQTNNYMETIIENDLQKLGFQKDESDAISHINTQSPYIYFKSKYLQKNEVLAIYKSLFNKRSLSNPNEALTFGIRKRTQWPFQLCLWWEVDILREQLFLIKDSMSRGTRTRRTKP